MSIQIAIDNSPNQAFTTYLDGARYEISLKTLPAQMMSASIIKNGVPILNGARLVCGMPLIPYSFMEAGNFLFLTENDESPYYTEFNKTQTLVYLTRAEVEALNG